MLVYDVTDLDSFEKIKSWHAELRKFIGQDAPILIAGNKADKHESEKLVKLPDAEAYARTVKAEHVSTSALSGHNVNYIFQTMA